MNKELEKITRTEEFAHIRDIAGIPAAITNRHHESLYHWQKAGLEEATLLSVDAHPDLDIFSKPELNHEYYRRNHITCFIGAAIHHEIVSSIYWLNPHWIEERLHYFDESVAAKVRKGQLPRSAGGSIKKEGKVITPPEPAINDKNPFILDFDLDAFCCSQGVCSTPASSDFNDGVPNWEQRVNETIDILRGLRRPDIITITRSQGNKPDIYVPSDKVNAVQEYLLEKLNELYHQNET
jgi:hypothetical protein